MASKTVLIVGGLGMIGIGIVHLRSSDDTARKFLYARLFGRRRPYKSKKNEEMGIALIRLVLGPTLIAAGCLLVLRGFFSLL